MDLGGVCPGVSDEVHATCCHLTGRDVTLLVCMWQWNLSCCVAGLRKMGGDICALGNVEGFQEWQRAPWLVSTELVSP